MYISLTASKSKCAAKSHLQSLFILQKKIVRIMTFAPYLEHFALIFRSLDLHWRRFY